MRGLGTVRPGRDAFRVGPLYADAPEVATALMTHLLSAVAKQAAAMGDREGGGDAAAALQAPLVDIDVPTANASASELVASLGFAPGFTCARMYKGTAPALPLHRIYGVGTLELG